MVPHHVRSLFWDTNVDTFDPVSYPVYTIARVLEHGDEEAVAWLRRTFTGEQILDVVRTDRRLSARSANFWALVFGLPLDDVAALRGSMRKTKEELVNSHIFRVVIEEDVFEDGRTAYHASCPVLQGCHSWGHTREEALAKVQEAVELYVADLQAAGEPVPVDPERGAVTWPSPAVVVNV